MTVSVSMEPVKLNNFLMVEAWWKAEAGYNSAFKNIPETLSSMGFEFEVGKFHA